MTPLCASKGVVFTRGDVKDALDLAEFAAHSFREAFHADNDPNDLEQHLTATYGFRQQTTELEDPCVKTVIARSDGAIVAYAQVRLSLPPSCVRADNPIELHRFYVDSSAHGSGLAQALMRQVHAAAREFNAEHLWLGVWERNARGIAFYKKQRFVDVGGKIYTVGQDPQQDRVLVAAVETDATA